METISDVLIIMIVALAGIGVCFAFLLCKLVRMSKPESDIYEGEIRKLKKKLDEASGKPLTREESLILDEAEQTAKIIDNETKRGCC